MKARHLLAISGLFVLLMASCQPTDGSLPRGKSSKALDQAFDEYVAAFQAAGEDLHSIMVVQNGKVLKEAWFGEAGPDVPHVLHSVSKTFTSLAVGFAITEGYFSLTDKVVDIFPDKVPGEVSENLAAMTVEDLLTMSCGHDTDPTGLRSGDGDWIEGFLAYPVDHKPGTYFCYNSLGTYMLSAIVQTKTGEKVVDYLQPRLFEPLGIDHPEWQESPQGINCGGWGLSVKTEDLAKVGQLILQKGKWNGKQVAPQAWIETMSTKHVECRPAGSTPEQVAERGLNLENSDWVQGYCYQMWRCRHNAVRADGAYGQYIIVIPEKNAVVATTANIGDMQEEINLIWDNILPAL